MVNKLKNKLQSQRVRVILVAVIVGAIGTYLLAGSRAATPFVAIDADRGSLAGRASIQNNAGARGGTYLRFDAAPQPPPPTGTVIPTNFRLLHKAVTRSDWDAVLIERYNASISDTPQGIRFLVNGPANLPGGRVETQLQSTIADEIPSDGGEAVYKWKVMVPTYVELSEEDSDGWYTISQHHGNNQSGYTGGVLLNLNNDLMARIEGGRRIDSNNYESELELPFGKLTRGRVHEIAMHVRWEEAQLNQNPNGFAIMYLDGKKGAEVRNVPTMGPQADNVMMRVGWYPKFVGPTGLDMYVSDYEVWVPR